MGRRVPLRDVIARRCWPRSRWPASSSSVYEAHGSLRTLEILLPVGLATALASEWIVRLGRPSAPLRRRRGDRRARACAMHRRAVRLDHVRLAPRRADDGPAHRLRGDAGAVGGAPARRRWRLQDLDAVRSTLAAVGDGRARRAHRPRVATTRSRGWAATWTRWSPAWTARSRPGARSSRPSRTTCGRRSRRCGLLATAIDDEVVDPRQAARIRRADEHARACARRADRRPVRAHAAAVRRACVDDGAGARRRYSCRRRWRRCAPPPTPARSRCAPSSRRAVVPRAQTRSSSSVCCST